jgi:hypothetical protein
MAVVLDEILGSATVHEISEPAGMRCSPPAANRGAENTSDTRADRQAREVFFITFLLVGGIGACR